MAFWVPGTHAAGNSGSRCACLPPTLARTMTGLLWSSSDVSATPPHTQQHLFPAQVPFAWREISRGQKAKLSEEKWLQAASTSEGKRRRGSGTRAGGRRARSYPPAYPSRPAQVNGTGPPPLTLQLFLMGRDLTPGSAVGAEDQALSPYSLRSHTSSPQGRHEHTPTGLQQHTRAWGGGGSCKRPP